MKRRGFIFAAASVAAVYSAPLLAQEVPALEKVNAKRIVDKLKPDLELIASWNMFESPDVLQAQLESYLAKIRDKRAIYDFAVVNATTPKDVRDHTTKFDIIIKPVKTIEFVYMPMHITTSGMTIG